jgi:uncharacterized protein YndB with AHSA1/START domain
MNESEATVHIGRSTSDVFELLDDAASAPLWMQACAELSQRSPGPKGVGSSLHYTYRQGGRIASMDGTVTGYDRGRHLAMHFTDRQFAVDVVFHLAPEAAGTTVTHRITITPRSFVGRLMSPMIGAGNRRQVAANLARAKALLERDGAPSPQPGA